jgi:Ca2+-binding EF-hand superfamily protein
MKTIPVSLIVAGILAPVLSLAQPEKGPEAPPACERDGKRGPQRPFVDFWKSIDADQDGFISKEEFDKMPRIQNLPEEKRLTLFNRLDKNTDCKLARVELERIRNQHGGQGPPMRKLWELDVNKSGGVSLEEFKAGEMFKKLPAERQDQIFKHLDTDQDGMITPKDRPQPPFRHGGGDPRRKCHEDGKPDGEANRPAPNRKPAS